MYINKRIWLTDDVYNELSIRRDSEKNTFDAVLRDIMCMDARDRPDVRRK